MSYAALRMVEEVLHDPDGVLRRGSECIDCSSDTPANEGSVVELRMAYWIIGPMELANMIQAVGNDYYVQVIEERP